MVRRTRLQAPVEPTRCPLCGEPNQCAGAGARATAGPCWCRGERFPFELLARSGTGKACICQRCLRAARDVSAINV